MKKAITIHTVNHVIEITLPKNTLWTMAKTLGEAFRQTDDMEGISYLRTIDGYRLLGETAVLRITLHDDELDELFEMSQDMDPATTSIKSDFVSYELHIPLTDLAWVLMQQIEHQFHLDAHDTDAPATHASVIAHYENLQTDIICVTILIHVQRQVEFERLLQSFCVTHEYAFVDHSEPFDQG